MRKISVYLTLIYCLFHFKTSAQSNQGNSLALKPPMGWMTWNYFADQINEKDIMEMADAMVSTGMLKAGYNYVLIDDGWQGGRDNKGRICKSDEFMVYAGLAAGSY
ncbi:Sip1-related alpha-galactosidase [Pedobacter cryoconitis]|uniref:Sip1-related alpha-galactosidase n=1 Tax=Pedobacter cryoconitis TaxID=188932 RepID=UPI000DB9DBF0|nr:Sip1-related alpha-galactosidase [Pedobacter cryoconitis]